MAQDSTTAMAPLQVEAPTAVVSGEKTRSSTRFDLPQSDEPPSAETTSNTGHETLIPASTTVPVPRLEFAKSSEDTAVSKTSEEKTPGKTPVEGNDAPKTDDPAAIDWKARILGRPLLPSVGEFEFEDFKNRWGEDARYHIIELLMGSERTPEQIRSEEARRASSTGKGQRRDVKADRLSGDTWIQRIRIHSPILLRHLREGMNAPDWDSEQPRVFFKPFKCLIHYHHHMKKILEELEETWANAQLSTGKDVQSGTESSQEENATATDSADEMRGLTALEHFRCYVNFMETRILPMTKMFNRIYNCMVRFDELWYLFKIGDIIYAPASNSFKAPGGIKTNKGRYQTAFMVYFKGISVIDDSEPDDFKVQDRSMTLWCYYIDYDGESYGPVKERIILEAFTGKKDIRELSAYPIRFAPNAEKLMEDWDMQGRRFRNLVQEKHVSCEGWTVGPPLGIVERNEQDAPAHIESDVIIDFGEALRTNPGWKTEFEAPNTELSNDWKRGIDTMKIHHWPDVGQPGKTDEPLFSIQECTQRDDDTEESLKKDGVEANTFLQAYKNGDSRTLDGLDDSTNNLLLPRRFFVYVLRQRRFAMVDIFSLKTIPPQSTIFDDLRIDENHKIIVQSLVADHFEKRRIQRQRPIVGPINQDLVQGKGSGLFILLHGVPGVGKTATAEAVAQANNKPLFTITCGDLGLTPDRVDSKLNDVFRLAHLWDCVLLLDEADIFLARRDTANLMRNALVSVFLRVLEYYSGILFLTTNRVGILDEAFKSRIHISLYYEPLSMQQTVEIFRVNIKKLRQIEDEKHRQLQGTELEQPRLRIMAKSIVAYAQRYYEDHEDTPHLRWNGRQIRNAFQIASSLAHYNMRKVSLSGENLASGQVAFPVLDEAQFERVAEATERFGNYMDYTKAMTDADQARIETIRADDIRNNDLIPRRGDYNASGVLRTPGSSYSRRSDEAVYQQRQPSKFGQTPQHHPSSAKTRSQGRGRSGGQSQSSRNIGQMQSGAARMSETPTRNMRSRPQVPPQNQSTPPGRMQRGTRHKPQPSQADFDDLPDGEEDLEDPLHDNHPGSQASYEVFEGEDFDDFDEGAEWEGQAGEVGDHGDDYDD